MAGIQSKSRNRFGIEICQMLDLLKRQPDIRVMDDDLKERRKQIITVSKIEERLALQPPLEARPRALGLLREAP